MPRGRTEHDLLERVGEIGHLHLLVAPAGREQGGLVGEVRQVGAHHAGGRGRQRVEVHPRGEGDRARVHFEDQPAPGTVGRLYAHAPVEATGPQKRRVKDVGAVGGGEHDHRLGRLEPVELGEDLIERLLALVIGSGDRH